MRQLKEKITLKHLFLFLGIGMPGLSKFVFAFVLQQRWGLEELGSYANDVNISIILSALTSTGFSVVLMNRIPQLTNKKDQRLLLGRVTFITLFLSILFLIIVYFLWILNWIKSFLGVSLLLIGYSNYQVFRHYLISKFEYKNVLLIEMLILVSVSFGFLFLTRSSVNPIVIHGVILVLFFGAFNFTSGRLYFYNLFKWDEIRSGLGFGFSNLSSTFLGLISVPVANQLLGTVYAGFLGLINPLIQLSVLIPRSLSNYYLPLMARFSAQSTEQLVLYRNFFRINTAFLFLIGSIIFLSWFIYVVLFPSSQLMLENITIILLLILINMIFTQISLPGFNMLAAWDKSKLSMVINFCMFIVFISLISVLSIWLTGFKAFVSIYIALIGLNILRWRYLSYQIRIICR